MFDFSTWVPGIELRSPGLQGEPLPQQATSFWCLRSSPPLPRCPRHAVLFSIALHRAGPGLHTSCPPSASPASSPALSGLSPTDPLLTSMPIFLGIPPTRPQGCSWDDPALGTPDFFPGPGSVSLCLPSMSPVSARSPKLWSRLCRYGFLAYVNSRGCWSVQLLPPLHLRCLPSSEGLS